MSLLQRARRFYRPIIGVLLIVLLVEPWVSGHHLYYNADPGEWVEYIGLAIVAIGWLGAGYLYDFLASRMRKTTPLHLPFLVIMGLSAIIGTPTMLFGDWAYPRVRLATQRPAMERYLADHGACPALRCLRDESALTAFVWGENNDVWTGACYDAEGAMAAAQLAAIEDRRAGRAPTARVFGGVSRRSNALSGSWIECAVRTPETAPR